MWHPMQSNLARNHDGVRRFVRLPSMLTQRAARGVQVAGLMGVVMCMYSGVGTQLFAFVKHGEPGGITRQVNFSSFGNSFLILFQCMTSDLLRRPPPPL